MRCCVCLEDTKQTASLPHMSDKAAEQEDFSPEELQLVGSGKILLFCFGRMFCVCMTS